MKSSFCHNKFNTFIGIIIQSWYKSEKIVHLKQHFHQQTLPVLCNSATCQWNLFYTFNIIKQRLIQILPSITNITLHLSFCPITVHLKLRTSWNVSENKHVITYDFHIFDSLRYNSITYLMFMALCIVLYFYWISLCMFRMVFPSIVRSPRMYIQLQVYVVQVRWLLTSKQSTCMTYTWICMYSFGLMTMDGKTIWKTCGVLTLRPWNWTFK